MNKETESKAGGWTTTLPLAIWFSVNFAVGLYGSGSLDIAREFFTGVAYAHDHARLVQFYNQARVLGLDFAAGGVTMAIPLLKDIIQNRRYGRQTDLTRQEIGAQGMFPPNISTEKSQGAL